MPLILFPMTLQVKLKLTKVKGMYWLEINP